MKTERELARESINQLKSQMLDSLKKNPYLPEFIIERETEGSGCNVYLSFLTSKVQISLYVYSGDILAESWELPASLRMKVLWNQNTQCEYSFLATEALDFLGWFPNLVAFKLGVSESLLTPPPDHLMFTEEDMENLDLSKCRDVDYWYSHSSESTYIDLFYSPYFWTINGWAIQHQRQEEAAKDFELEKEKALAWKPNEYWKKEEGFLENPPEFWEVSKWAGEPDWDLQTINMGKDLSKFPKGVLVNRRIAEATCQGGITIHGDDEKDPFQRNWEELWYVLCTEVWNFPVLKYEVFEKTDFGSRLELNYDFFMLQNPSGDLIEDFINEDYPLLRERLMQKVGEMSQPERDAISIKGNGPEPYLFDIGTTMGEIGGTEECPTLILEFCEWLKETLIKHQMYPPTTPPRRKTRTKTPGQRGKAIKRITARNEPPEDLRNKNEDT
jgi:hypothetical protein